MSGNSLEKLKENRKQGRSLPFVACAGAFLLAFALALVYTASVMLSNANKKISEERCYQLAKSFAQAVGQELLKPESEFCQFANKFLNQPDYNEYQPDHPETVYHYAVRPEEENKDYGKVSIELRKELNEDDLSGLSGTVPVPSNELANYAKTISDLEKNKFQRYIFTVEVIVRQDDLTYNYTTEYYREDQYPIVFRYLNQVIVWDGTQWVYGDMAGTKCDFTDPSVPISYTYDTKNPKDTRFIPMHEEGGGS